MQFSSFPGEISHQAHCGVLPESAAEGHVLVCEGMSVLYIPQMCKKTIVTGAFSPTYVEINGPHICTWGSRALAGKIH